SEAAVCHGPWVVMAKYSYPHWKSGLSQSGSFGSSPLAASSGAFDVVPTYFRSAPRSSLAWMQPVVTLLLQFGRAPLLACSSKPATIDWTAASPVPWWTPVPLSGSDAVWIAPLGMWSTEGWVMVEAGLGAE